MKIAIGSDHAGYDLKEKIKKYFDEIDVDYIDYGTHSNESADYPDFAHLVAKDVEENNKIGVLICGSGNGINMTANKHQGIRSALCWNKEIAELARLHNDANIIALPARFIKEENAIEAVKVFIKTDFEGGRHTKRVNKISC